MRAGSIETLADFGALPVEVEFYLDSYPGPAWEVSSLRYRTGWLMVSRATMETPFSSWSAPLVACVNEECEPISAWHASKFFEMRCSAPREAFDLPPDELELVSDALYWDFLGTCDLKHLAILEEQEAEESTRIIALEAQAEAVLDKVDLRIQDLRRWKRAGRSDGSRLLAVDQQIALLEEKRVAAAAWLRRQIAAIRAVGASFAEDVMASLLFHGSVELLYVVRWKARSLRDRPAYVQGFELRYGNKTTGVASTIKEVDEIADRCRKENKAWREENLRRLSIYISPKERRALNQAIKSQNTIATKIEVDKNREFCLMLEQKNNNKRIQKTDKANKIKLRVEEVLQKRHSSPEFVMEMERKREIALRQKAKRDEYAMRRKREKIERQDEQNPDWGRPLRTVDDA